jgi:hypothetical protein
VSIQAGPAGFGAGLVNGAAPPLRALTAVPGRVIAAISLCRAG